MVNRTISKKTYKGFQLAAENLSRNEELLNNINLIPVPDRDTGANMALSIRKVAEALSPSSSARDLFIEASGILLHNAKGNSGTILTLFFSGIAYSLEDSSCRSIARAIMNGAEKAYNGISNPMDGTILTVAIKAAEAGLESVRDNTKLPELVSAIALAARNALKLTTLQNPILKEQQVVDSGALGLCMIIDGFEAAFNNKETVDISYGEIKQLNIDETEEELKYFFCTEFVITKPSRFNMNSLKNQLEELGDCIIPVETSDRVKVHIHTDRPEAVFFIASLCGRLISTKVDNMKLQSETYSDKSRCIFLCRAQLTSDCIKSMGYKEVFIFSGGECPEFKEKLESLDPESSYRLYTSVKASKEISGHFDSIVFFSDDDVFMDYLFAEAEV